MVDMPSRWARRVKIAVVEKPATSETQKAIRLPAPQLIQARRSKRTGRPPKKDQVPDNQRVMTSFNLRGRLFNRMKAFLKQENLSQTEYIETLIRNDLALRGI